MKIAKIIKDAKRRTIVKFDTYNIEKIGKYNSFIYKRYETLPGVNKQILTHNLIQHLTCERICVFGDCLGSYT